jgi:uncharacterized protein involved in response to NO
VTARSLAFREPFRESAPSALFSKGFRPFFLLAAAFAALCVPIWLLALRGGWQPGGALGAMQWHAHEMLFGFTVAVIAGFLLTAVANWTERETAVGLPLFLLCALWLLGRAALFFAGSLPGLVPALLDLAFLPALGVACARPLVASRNRQNYVFIVLILLLFSANACAHVGALRQNPTWVRSAHHVALDLIQLIILLVTARVLPMFTRNATQRSQLRTLPALERAAGVAFALLLLADALALPESVSAPCAALAGVFALARMRHWGTAHSFREPLLWVLHVGALWLPLGLLLRAAAAYWTSVPPSSALHSLTAGAIGTLTLGMMARVSLGHTGRALRAPKFVVFAFGLVIAAGLLRVLGPFLPGAWYMSALAGSGALWSAAFLTFLVAYSKVLTTPRLIRV